jgi:excisionase family DNA binding protein
LSEAELETLKNLLAKTWDTEEVCRATGVGRHSVYRWVRDGQLAALVLGPRNFRFSPFEVVRFMKSKRRRGRPRGS